MPRLPLLFLSLFLLGACASLPPAPPAGSPQAQCLERYQALDRAVAQHGYSPTFAARIPGFPYLRVDRFLASYREEPLTPPQSRAWLQALAGLDREARRIELASLTAARRAALPNEAELTRCTGLLVEHDLAVPARIALLRQRAVVPDDYVTGQRVFGLYPLTALGVAAGVRRWQAETRAVFALPRPQLPTAGIVRRYAPQNPAAIFTVDYTALPRDALGIPRPTPAQLASLYAQHAPLLELDQAGPDDYPGAPRWAGDALPTVDAATPLLYRYASYTRWRGEPLLQLNYVVWFSARPKNGALDILGGPLDGLMWRVTLDHNGRPLLYDSIHPCGCYHKFFPSHSLRLRAAALNLPEPPLVLPPPPAPGPGQRLVLRIASGTHYLQRVYPDTPGATLPYQWRDYAALYTVPDQRGGRRSLFGADALVLGSERLERFILWPMGIPSPGGMRERGHHATAFLGRRHFDDADLLEQLFEPAS
ncbi:MAG TPA: hypothetical protein VNN09_10910 [Candidatus Competibacteraceae bacterium]|nr:hypothetical protein [Candidatus Competibacteraceae bacterium]